MGGRGSGPRREAERDREMLRLRRQGLTLAAIGRRFGLTRQAVKAAIDRQGGAGEPPCRHRGFADLPPDQRRAVSGKGGGRTGQGAPVQHGRGASRRQEGRQGRARARHRAPLHQRAVQRRRQAERQGPAPTPSGEGEVKARPRPRPRAS
jgi:hypothetical protein